MDRWMDGQKERNVRTDSSRGVEPEQLYPVWASCSVPPPAVYTPALGFWPQHCSVCVWVFCTPVPTSPTSHTHHLSHAHSPINNHKQMLTDTLNARAHTHTQRHTDTTWCLCTAVRSDSVLLTVLFIKSSCFSNRLHLTSAAANWEANSTHTHT